MPSSPSLGIDIPPLKDSLEDHRPETREWDKHPGETLLPPLPLSHLLGQFQYLHNLLLRQKCLSITEIKKILHVGKSDFY